MSKKLVATNTTISGDEINCDGIVQTFKPWVRTRILIEAIRSGLYGADNSEQRRRLRIVGTQEEIDLINTLTPRERYTILMDRLWNDTIEGIG